MEHFQKHLNDMYFAMVLNKTNDGGTYIWVDAKEAYTVKNRKFIGSKTAIKKIKKITTPDFHTNLIVK